MSGTSSCVRRIVRFAQDDRSEQKQLKLRIFPRQGVSGVCDPHNKCQALSNSGPHIDLPVTAAYHREIILELHS
jgi:hypothetical protein